MPSALPYLPSYKNVAKLFERIAAAEKPPAFTHKFLLATLGLKSTGDRALISLLKSLGFVDGTGKPTESYGLLKNKAAAPAAIAAGVRKAYAPLFAANENANGLQIQELKGLIAQVAGTDEKMSERIAGTFAALAKVGNFAAKPAGESGDGDDDDGDGETDREEDGLDQERKDVRRKPAGQQHGIGPDFHYNIQVHLPSNGSEETYINIFNAIRRAFK